MDNLVEKTQFNLRDYLYHFHLSEAFKVGVVKMSTVCAGSLRIIQMCSELSAVCFELSRGHYCTTKSMQNQSGTEQEPQPMTPLPSFLTEMWKFLPEKGFYDSIWR